MSDAPSPSEGKKLRRPVEEVRAELLADADVKEQARLLKLPVEKYVEKILDYALHPEKPPAIMIVPDEALKQQDPQAPTVAEIETYLQKVVSGEVVVNPAHQPDGFHAKEPADRYGAALGSADDLQGAKAKPAEQDLGLKKDSNFKG
ncbi:hypothetical protein [Archangium primigenium]|uniref:hypothetical protein n=1 Tax=[Archangium] primigenium TaxID=2792470 RepID=UPI001EF7CE08|nr:hypothetical protein [Archangium primigenium]